MRWYPWISHTGPRAILLWYIFTYDKTKMWLMYEASYFYFGEDVYWSEVSENFMFKNNVYARAVIQHARKHVIMFFFTTWFTSFILKYSLFYYLFGIYPWFSAAGESIYILREIWCKPLLPRLKTIKLWFLVWPMAFSRQLILHSCNLLTQNDTSLSTPD